MKQSITLIRSELFLKISITRITFIQLATTNLCNTNIHIHTAISVDLLALSRHSNLLVSTFCFHFFNLLFQFDPTSLDGPQLYRSPSLVNQVTHNDMILLKVLFLYFLSFNVISSCFTL